MNALRHPRLQRVGLSVLLSLLPLGVLAYLVYRERDAFVNFDWNLYWPPLGVAVVFMTAGVWLAAMVWASMMSTLGSRTPYPLHLRYYVYSQLARRLPGTIWYVAGRGVLYRRHGEALRLVTVASGVELVVSIVAGALVTLALSTLALTTLPGLYLIVMAAAAAVGALTAQPQGIRWLLRRIGLADAPELRVASVARWLALYGLIWLLGAGIFFCNVYAITRIDLQHLPFIMASWSLVGVLSVLVIFLPSNLGFTEVGVSLLLSLIMPSSLAVMTALLARVFTLAIEVIACGAALLAVALSERWFAERLSGDSAVSAAAASAEFSAPERNTTNGVSR